ncbi:alpha/beta fold hydrolase [Novosphingobium pokkalii]|uniref:Alpha/beta fold hydrolase n=1 Tax=Novosphingobium pokkalii TaxID=1770194 RepID=A0ABV7V8K2_9SPHN|nr:alpha/beta hydrolase [Novosphingobium pokkalii]GHD01046.1 alpha/beta hydrolase [Novosphingobium pokkalii]
MNFVESSDRYPLAAFAGEKPPAPEWYRRVMADLPEVGTVEVDKTAIEFLTWGDIGKPGLLLIHGNFAHAHWWGPLSPLLGRDYRVCAMSLAGMGGSGWRTTYSVEVQVQEAFAAAQAAQLFAAAERPTVIAHSFGAEPAIFLAARIGERFSRALLLDCGVAPTTEQETLTTRGRSYPTIADALARFRLAPPQHHRNLFILDDIARKGLVQTDDGAWRWRFDPHFWSNLEAYDGWSTLAAPKCPLAFIYGEDSTLVTPELVVLQQQQAPKGTPFIPIVGAGHHLMIDQPFAVYAAIRGVIEEARRTQV